MNAIANLTWAAIFSMGLSISAQAGDMGSVVVYSLGEFDRVGMGQSVPQTQSGKSQKKPATRLAQSAQNRQMSAQKAEFVRRMFWMALSMR